MCVAFHGNQPSIVHTLTICQGYPMKQPVTVEGDNLPQQLLLQGEEEGVVGRGVPLTRSYHTSITNKTPELEGGVDVSPLPKTQLWREHIKTTDIRTPAHYWQL